MKKLMRMFIVLPLLVITSSCQNRSLEDGLLTIGLEAAYAPFNWTSTNHQDVPLADTGFLGIGRSYVAGYDIMIANFIVADQSFDLQVRKISWDGLIPALQSGHIDAIIAGMTDTAARRESVSFSSPYYESELVMVVRLDGDFSAATSIADFSGARLAAQIGTVQNDIIADYASDDGDDDLYVPGLIASTPYETYPDALLALLEVNSGLDGVLAERPIGEAMIAEYPNTLGLVEFYTDEDVYDENFLISVSIAVRKTDVELLNKINNALEKIDVATRIEMMEAAIIASHGA